MNLRNSALQQATALHAVLFAAVGLMLLIMPGCSVYKASNQPEKKNLSVLSPGTPRSYVIAELGTPSWSGEKDGAAVDLFAFRQGYSKGAKIGRAFFHGAADVVTAGLWEVVATPIETIADGTAMKVEVIYDTGERVKLVNYLEGR
jgi:hypothetical protein